MRYENENNENVNEMRDMRTTDEKRKKRSLLMCDFLFSLCRWDREDPIHRWQEHEDEVLFCCTVINVYS
jgi:hypothetical protein